MKRIMLFGVLTLILALALAPAVTGQSPMRIFGTSSTGAAVPIGATSGALNVAISGSPTLTKLTITQGTTATAIPTLSMTTTWNDGAGDVTYTGLKYVITDTESNAASLAMQILGGAAGTTNLMSVSKVGKVEASGTVQGSALVASAAGYMGSGRGLIRWPSDGVWNLLNGAETNLARLNLGPATSLFPALSVTSAATPTLTVIAGDGSGASNLSVTGTLTSTLGATIQGLTVGLGPDAVATNTIFGVGIAAGVGTLGAENTLSGYLTATFLATGASNTSFGARSLYNLTSGNGNVALGTYAGSFSTTESNEFFVDNQSRTNRAGDIAGALLYGTFNATPASQTLRTNAAFYVTEFVVTGPYSGSVFGTGGTINIGPESQLGFQYGSNAASRNWGFDMDRDAFGDFHILTSSAKTAGLLDTPRLSISPTGGVTIPGTLTVSGAGPHAIGGATVNYAQFYHGGTFAGVSNAYAHLVGPTLTLPVNGFGGGLSFQSLTFTEAASGTHPMVTGVSIYAPTVTAGAAQMTNTASLYISDAMSATVTGANYALWVAAGASKFGGDVSAATFTAPGGAGVDCTSAAAVTVSKGIVTACSQPVATPAELLQMIADLRAELASLKARQ